LVPTLPKNLHLPRTMSPQTNKNNRSQRLSCALVPGVQKEISLIQNGWENKFPASIQYLDEC
jgi:hypothetical protein